MTREHLSALAVVGYLQKESAGLPQITMQNAPAAKGAIMTALRTFFGSGGAARTGAKWVGKHPIAGTAIGLTGGGAVLGGLGGARHLASSVGSDYEPSGQAPGEAENPINPALLGAGAGGVGGGLASLVYGKLADKPDLQRDLISALVGAGVGGAYGAYEKSNLSGGAEKTAAHEKEAEPISIGTIALLTLMAAGTGGGLYSANKAHKQGEKALSGAESLRAEQEKAWKASDRVTGTGVGMAAGGAAGGLASAGYGKVTGKENLRRDLLSALAGSAAGGVAGAVYGPGMMNQAPSIDDQGTADA